MRAALKELREMSLQELNEKLSDLRAGIFKERASITTKGGSKNTRAIKYTHFQIARVETVLHEKMKAEHK